MTIRTKVTRTVGRTSLRLKHGSPHILFGVGVIGVVTSTVLACRATLRLEKTVDEMELDIAEVKFGKKDSSGISVPGSNKALAVAYAKGSFELVKLYAPAVTVGGTSLILLTGSHVQLSRRNTALTVAYSGLHQAYAQYRDRVRGYVGDDKERDLYHGVTLEKIEGPDGKKKEMRVADPNGLSVYARFFDETSPNWNKDPELNRLFVQCQQNWLNHRLHAIGHVFLNEAYDALGIDRSSAGQIVGWVIGEEGDNYIDFGIFDCENSRFVNGWERSILLDFNVDGPVIDKI